MTDEPQATKADRMLAILRILDRMDRLCAIERQSLEKGTAGVPVIIWENEIALLRQHMIVLSAQ